MNKKQNQGCSNQNDGARFAPILTVSENRGGWKHCRPGRKTEAGRLLKKIANRAGKAVEKFNLIEEGDRILVALSGGKDSWTLLEICLHLRDTAPIKFEIETIHMDPGPLEGCAEEKPPGTLPDYYLEIQKYLKQLGVGSYFLKTDILHRSTVMNKERKTNPCFLCSRFRRGILYRTAVDLGFNKIALGHHADDLVETLLLNQFFSGQTKSMPPKLFADDGRNIVIRPLCNVFEKQTSLYAKLRGIPLTAPACASCGSVELERRIWMKKLLEKLETEVPGLKGYLLAGMSHVRPSHLMDTDIFDFAKGSLK